MQDKMHTQVLETVDMDRSRVELANLLARRRGGKGLLRCCDPVSTITSLQITGQAPHTFPSQDVSECLSLAVLPVCLV